MHSLSSIPRNLFLCLDNNPRLDLRAFQLSVVYQKPKQEELSIRIKETIAKSMSARGKNKQTARRAGKRKSPS